MLELSGGKDLDLLYQIYTMQSSIFTHALSLEFSSERKEFWNEIVDLTISDIGIVSEHLSLINQDMYYGIHLISNDELLKNLDFVYKRFAWFNKTINNWTLLNRLPSVLIRCENYIFTLLPMLEREYFLDHEYFQSLSRQCEQRINNLKKIAGSYINENRKLQEINISLSPKLKWSFT